MRYAGVTSANGGGPQGQLPPLRRDINHSVGRAPAASHGVCAGGVVYAAALKSFSLRQYEGGGYYQRSDADGNPGRDVFRGLRQPRYALYAVCSAGSRFLPDHHPASGEPRGIAATSETRHGADLLPVENLGDGGNFPRWRISQLCQTDGVRRYRHRQQFYSLVPVLHSAVARISVCRPPLAVG